MLNKGDIIISARGTVGAIAQVAIPMAFNQSCYGIKGIKGISDTDFLFYALKMAVSDLQHIAHGAVFSTITKDTFANIYIPFPELQEQRRIASILGNLDDQIENNRKLAKTLEAMAQAIFQSWFVDFDPVRAKRDGRWHRGGSLPGLPAHLYDLFPDSFEESELGEIPKGWAVRPFTELVEVIGGGTPKTSIAEYWNGNIPWFSVTDAPAEGDIFVIDTEKHITQKGLENSAASLLPEGTTIISARGTVGKVALVGVPMAMNQSCYGLRGIEAGVAFTYLATRSLVLTLKQRSHGSVFDTITRDTLAGVNFIAAPKLVLDAFELVADPLMQRIKSNLYKSCALATLRNALLPKLIAGEIRTNKAAACIQ